MGEGEKERKKEKIYIQRVKPISCMPSVGQMRMIEVPLHTTRPKSRIPSKIFWWSSASITGLIYSTLILTKMNYKNI
jgi:hypothetical protein